MPALRAEHRREADAEPVDHAGPEPLDDHVGAVGQAQERLATVVGLEVEQRPFMPRLPE